LTALALTLISLFTFAPGASADKVIAERGEGAGQTKNPQGLAVDDETGRLYVADESNNRIDVFDSSGAFVMSLGWGVDTKANEFQICTTASTCNAGIAGPGAGQFSEPVGIAVDNDPTSPSFHDIYVVDSGNLRIEKFNPAGEFQLTFGSAGTGPGQFSQPRRISADVGPGGIVYVGDSKFKNGFSESEGFESRVQKFEPSGALALQYALGLGSIGGLAVDSTGSFYVRTQGLGGGLRKYDSSGNLTATLSGNNDSPTAITTDSTDHLFGDKGGGTVDRLGHIVEYDSSGAELRSFAYRAFQGYTNVNGLAPYHSASGDIYASELQSGSGGELSGGRVMHVSFAPPGPVVLPEQCKASLGNTTATLNADVNPEGKATTFHFQYLDEKSFEEEGGFASPHTKTTAEIPLSLHKEKETKKEEEEFDEEKELFELHQASAKVTGLVPETTYRCRVVATNADEPDGVTGEGGAFTTLEPFEILATWSSEVGAESATLNAEVNPLEIPTIGYFEYVDDAGFKASGFAAAKKAPNVDGGEEAINFGAGKMPKTGSTPLGGLKPCSVYHYRVVVDDPVIAPRTGPARIFRTICPGPGGLPDERAYELVSPALKNSAEVAVPGAAGGGFLDSNVRIEAASITGEAITYTSWTSFGDAQAAPATSQYLSKRGGNGWSTENIVPPGISHNPLTPPFRGFTPDLGFGAVVVDEPALTEDALTGFSNLYLRNDVSGKLRAITTEPPEGSISAICPGYAGATADAQRVIFAAGAAFSGAPEVKGNGVNLYEWSAGEGLALVSVLPGGTPAKPFERTGFGPAGGNGCGEFGSKIVRHAISADGSRIFWTYAPSSSESELLARLNGTETIQLDAIQGGAGPAGNGQFWNASAAGSKAFFTAASKLTADAGASAGAADLYRYDLGAPAGARLEDLTPGSLTPGPEAADVQGVLGASEDGSYLYFAARGILSGEENGQGQKAQAGKSNLYLWHEGEPVKFIATLPEDNLDWSAVPKTQTAQVSPNGHYLAFISSASLTGYDNTVDGTTGCSETNDGELFPPSHCAEAYLYDAESDQLTCASCNPSGARPLGPTALPAWSNPYEQPHYLSNDGSRLFFDSRDALDPRDTNNRLDVYEFERSGNGSCNAQSASFSEGSGGCLYLISSGENASRSYLIDASSNGRDVFFSTRQLLLGADENENYDVYDVREGGGFPEPSEQPPCQGEACKPPPPPPPSSSSASSASFQGPGNLSGGRSPQCQKGKVRRKGRCVNTHKRHKSPHRRADHNRRAS
jgi:hypothetical protein